MSKFLEISDLEAGNDKEPIWALNNGPHSDIRSPGEIVVGIPKINGSKSDALHLPQTWLPICLTDQISRLQLLASTEFRNAVNSGLVKLISTAYAKELLEQEGAAEEKSRLAEQKQNIRSATANRAINPDLVSVSGTDGKPTEEVSANTQQDEDDLDTSFIAFLDVIREKTDIEAMNVIRNRGSLKAKQIKRLIEVCIEKPKTREFLESVLRSHNK